MSKGTTSKTGAPGKDGPHRHRGGGQGQGQGKKSRPAERRGAPDPDALMRDLMQKMEACPNAESLNDSVLMPFMLAMEKVCGARGYVMNIYGETGNLVFTGDEERAEAIYQIVEAYLDDAEDDT